MQGIEKFSKTKEGLYEKSFSFSKSVEKFISYKKAIGIGERTELDYKRLFKNMTAQLKKDELYYDTFRDFIQNFMASKAGKAPATYNVPLGYIISFCNWAVDVEGFLPENPVKALKLKKRRDNGRVRTIQPDDIKKVLSVLNLNTYTGFRDYTIIMVTLDTGIRPSELFHLREENFDTKYNKLKIPVDIAKTDRDRILNLSQQTSELLIKLISVKDSSWDDLIIHTCEGGALNTDRWTKQLARYSVKAGVKMTAYDFRHTFAIMFLKNGGNLFALQDIMGHSDLTMTRRYVKFASEDTEQQHSKASPVKDFLKRNTKVRKLFKGH